MSFDGGGTREGPEIWSKISRRNFWPGSKRRDHARLRYTTLGDMLFNEIPLREHHRVRGPFRGFGRTPLPQWAKSGDRLAPRPATRRRG